MTRPIRGAMSILEVLIVLGILSLLAALILCGVQRARESAARLQCQNNLRQIGLALHQFHDTNKRFPAGVRVQGGKDRYPYMSWQTQLLPFLEQGALWEQTDRAFRLQPNFLKNPPHVGFSTPMRVFSCPIDSRTATAHPIADGFAPALTSYLGVEGTNSFRQDGILYLDSAIRVTDVTDGTSHTILVGERPASADRILGWWYAGMGQDMDGEGDSVLGTRTKNNFAYAPNCPVGPYAFAVGKLTNQCDAFHFWSPHPGGANFLFAGGNVRFLAYSADPLLPALGTRAGGELLGPLD